VEEWKKSGSRDDNIFFRPYVAGEESDTVVSSASDDDDPVPVMQCKQSMLFVHQLAWQKNLLLRYGQDICLLDATYKTCKYALPLFFVCVKTNVGYQVAATFILQNELQQDIQEALLLLKNWNPDWNPAYFMTDKCVAEINAIETSFSSTTNKLSDLY